MSLGRVLAAALVAGAVSLPGFAQSAAAPGPAPFDLTERSDFSRYVDGSYIGHVYREARGSLSPTSAAGANRGYSGVFLVLEETLRDARDAARKVDRSAPVRLTVGSGGSLSVAEDSGYPSLRGLPSFPDESSTFRIDALQPGDSWTGSGFRALDFDDSGAFVLIPFLAEYKYVGTADYNGRKALSLTAKFATRWKAGQSADLGSSDEESGSKARPVSEVIRSATGTHDLGILVDAETHATLFIRDHYDETFVLAAGSSERRSGFSLFFFEGAARLDRGAAGAAIIAAVDRAGAAGPGSGAAAGGAAGNGGASSGGAAGAGNGGAVSGGAAGNGGASSGGAAGNGSGTAALDTSPPGAGPGRLDAGEAPTLADNGEFAKAGLELDASPEGMVLRVRDLRFVADSDAILPSELWRLDAIAAALKAIPNRSFLVAGHSAAVGNAAGELELSVRRAKRVADALTARGIDAARLLYRGYGSGKPLASNDTEVGRAKNRRVEITILD